MTVLQVFDQFKKSLNEIYDHGEAEAISLRILLDVAGIKKSDILLQPSRILEPSKADDLVKCLLRLEKGEPVQYVLGFADFFGLKFEVNPAVLIPRPETEELVEWILKEAVSNPPESVLDIGTGSGCIAIALKKNLPEATVTATDVSASALKVARRNAEQNGTSITFFKHDLLSALELPTAMPLDVIVSNPPYVLRSEGASMHRNVVGYEPHVALFVPEQDPLVYYKAILRVAERYLHPKGRLFLEIHPSLVPELKQLFEPKGFAMEIRHDLSGHPRMVSASR